MDISRRFFVGSAGALCAGMALGSSAKSPERVRFLVFADIHHDLIPDAPERLRQIIARAEAEKVDFIVELGDFCFPLPHNQDFKAAWDSTAVRRYHVLGNHDMDKNTKADYTAYWEMPGTHYTFDKGPFRFVVLDSNFFNNPDGSFAPYTHANYFSKPGRDSFSPEQLQWLEALLKDKSRVYCLFSHAPVNDGYAEVRQNRALHEILTRARAAGTRIAGAFAGHIHSDNYHRIDGINYMQVNSASYIWGGGAFKETRRYPEDVHKKYSALKYTINYETPLSAVVEITADGSVAIQGAVSRYRPPAPDEALLKEKMDYPCSPVIENRAFRF